MTVQITLSRDAIKRRAMQMCSRLPIDAVTSDSGTWDTLTAALLAAFLECQGKAEGCPVKLLADVTGAAGWCMMAATAMAKGDYDNKFAESHSVIVQTSSGSPPSGVFGVKSVNDPALMN